MWTKIILSRHTKLAQLLCFCVHSFVYIFHALLLLARINTAWKINLSEIFEDRNKHKYHVLWKVPKFVCMLPKINLEHINNFDYIRCIASIFFIYRVSICNLIRNESGLHLADICCENYRSTKFYGTLNTRYQSTHMIFRMMTTMDGITHRWSLTIEKLWQSVKSYFRFYTRVLLEIEKLHLSRALKPLTIHIRTHYLHLHKSIQMWFW